ncbi:dihydroorotate dehydrogenase electron transfer subunit [Candidatus Woesearchaeota archaeon]|jgi:dihydroorotate dehydrogenase electron transfer subunit|nr:dihydroorotate dehydrogenase electron transfer subunit [Candidatus Woesearchaeota archaeon]
MNNNTIKNNFIKQDITQQDIPYTTKVVEVIKHNENFVTVWLEGEIKIKPGQFIMVWFPNVEEKPFTITCIKENKFSFTAMKRGPFTKALFELKVGDLLGWRGPYGNTFTIDENVRNVCIVAGGIGMAAVCLLYKQLKNDNKNVKLIYGAKCSDGLIFKDLINNICVNSDACFCTDDGSEGDKAFTTELLEKSLSESLSNEKFDIVYTCGPEIMMKKVVELCEKYNVECEVSLERYMGCGFGICGGCSINHKLVCIDGPVFNSKELKELKDFGNHVCKCNKE